MAKKKNPNRQPSSSGEDRKKSSSSSSTKQSSSIRAPTQQQKRQASLSALHRLEEGIPLQEKEGGKKRAVSTLPQPPVLARSRNASARQTSSASRPGAFAINSLCREGRSRSDDNFSISELTEVTGQPAGVGEASSDRDDAPAAAASSQTAPSTSPVSEMTPDVPIVATLVKDIGLPARTYEHDSVPEAIRTSIWGDRRVRLVIGILIVMVVVAVGAVVGLLVFGGSDDRDDKSKERVLPTDSRSSAAPSVSPTRVGQEVLDILIGASFDGGGAMLNASTPQNLASEWLLSDPNAMIYSQTRLLQRYALATLYYSAVVDNDESDFTSQPLLHENDECLNFGFAQCDNQGNVIAVEHAYTSMTRGTLPDEVGLLSDLQVLDLSNNRFRGTLPTTLGLLQELTALRLRYNYFSGTMPSQIGGLSKLRDGLGLEGNTLTGEISSSLGQLSILRWMGLHGNNFVGSIPSTIWSMTALRNIYLSENQLTGTISTAVGQLSNLMDASFGGNEFVGTLPTQLANLEYLVKLQVAGNELTGTLPFQLFERLTNLKYLDLGHNKFQGSIPTQLSLLTSLSETLRLNNNMLTSTIPTELGRLRRLAVDCDFSNNLLSGSIPTELGWLTKLEQSLSLADNGLSGAIPSELGALSLLSNLRLENNVGIVGKIPSSLGQIQSLVVLAVYGSGLTGSVPEDICFLRDVQLTALELDCDVLCTCCDEFCF